MEYLLIEIVKKQFGDWYPEKYMKKKTEHWGVTKKMKHHLHKVGASLNASIRIGYA